MLGAAALLLLLADIGYALISRYLPAADGDAMDVLFLLSYLCWGLPAVHPSMVAAQPWSSAVGRQHIGIARLVLLTVSSLLAPALLFVPGIRAQTGDWLVVSGGTVVLFLLVAGRMSGFVRQVQQQAGRLEQLALRDALTGLGNRRQLEKDMQAMVATGTPYVALLDLTGFKKVNDRLGHHAGDLLLVEVAERLRRAAGNDPVVRLGGDRFAVLINGDRDRATGLATRITQALAEPIHAAGHDLLIGANIGLAHISDAGEPLEGLRRADVAMYAAKEHGQPYRWYSPELDKRHDAEEELRAAPTGPSPDHRPAAGPPLAIILMRGDIRTGDG